MSAEERMAERAALRRASSCARGGCARCSHTPSPLTERMTLFWHNHFATSQQKVRIAQLMYRQNVLLRREALATSARCCTRSRATRRC
jgi:uncharacterized protein (DUF1800 family)